MSGAESLPSAALLTEGSKLAATGHENRLTSLFEGMGLSATIPISFVEVGLSQPHPTISMRGFVHTLSEQGKLDVIFCGHTQEDYSRFWERFQLQQPSHEVFLLSKKQLSRTVPMWIHGDEGTSQKKRGIMILSSQAILGYGTSRSMDLNFVKNSILTRSLYSVMATRLYSGKMKKNKPLYELVRHMALDLASCYHDPIPVKHEGSQFSLRLLPLGLKGDLPAVAKLMKLQRHFLRDTWLSANGPGICPLCTAGAGGSSWHDVSFGTMLRLCQDAPLPWKEDPDFLKELPHSEFHKAEFCLVDVFHTIHKGVLGDACANGIAACIHCSTQLFLISRFCIYFSC